MEVAEVKEAEAEKAGMRDEGGNGIVSCSEECSGKSGTEYSNCIEDVKIVVENLV